MPCYKGSTQIKTIKKGSTEIERVYKGETLVYINNQVIYLGEGQTFDITKFYDDYKNLTVDNFFILSASNISAQISCPFHEPSGTNWTHSNGGLEKKYDKASGKLTLRLYATSACATIGTAKTNYANVKAVLVTNPNKLIKLTSVSSNFNDPGYNRYNLPVDTYPDFASYGVNNFLIGTAKDIVQPHSFYGDTVIPQTAISIAKNYSKYSNYGTLETYIQVVESLSGGPTSTLRYHVTPYLYKPGVVIT